MDGTQYLEPRDEREAYERRSLDDDLATWIEKYPDVQVERQVVEGRAADVLISFARKAQLVVVGTRGHGGFAGLLLGSVAQQLMHHSDSPVLIAR
jgi:nucleotide-binding universal stress UspA family protein